MSELKIVLAGSWFLAVGMLAVGCVAPAQPVCRIAFGSCAKQDRPQPIWDAVLAADPDLFLFIGDAVYAETTDMNLMRAQFDRLNAVPGYRALRSHCPVLATWDDNDYGLDDGGAAYPMRAEAQQVFLDAFDVPAGSARRTRRGVYHAETFGSRDKRVQVILLDTRYFRGLLTRRDNRTPAVGPYVPGRDTRVTMLGDEQWRWLEQRLREPARVRIIASSIQVVAEDHGWEKWMNLPHERACLFDLIRKCRAGGVVFISGDRHAAELSAMDGGVGYTLHDLTSSGMNCALAGWYEEPNRHRVGEKIWADNFGLITIEWDTPDPELCFEIRGTDASVMTRHCVRLGDLHPKRQ